MVSTLKFLLLGAILLPLLLIGSASAAESLAYYSDYISFIGQDETGYLLCALDNRRGVDGEDFQAEHFGVIYDQHQGWIELAGTGKYPNPLGFLTRIPDSATFQFAGHPGRGIRIRSRINDLRLEINPLQIQLTEVQGEPRQNWGSAAAVLYWQGRTIPGRVIYEELIQHNRNRLNHRYLPIWDNYQGFYLALKIGPPAVWQDIYLRAREKEKMLYTKGFVNTGQERAEINAPDLTITKKSWALGFYRWAKGWQMHLKVTSSTDIPNPLTPYLTLKQVSRRNITNWVIGGFALSVVEGTIEVDGRSSRVLGFAKLIK